MKVYAVQYCDCIYESAFATESLHSTKAGAAKAMNALKSSRYEQDVRTAEIHDDSLLLVSLRMNPGRYSSDAYRFAVLEVQA